MKETNIAEILISNIENLKSAFAINRAIHGAKKLLVAKLRGDVEASKELQLKADFAEDISSLVFIRTHGNTPL